MKFATYRYEKNDKLRFGFKKGEHIIDIKRYASWLKERHGKTTYLNIPCSLKEALKNWRVNFEKLKQLEALLKDEDIKKSAEVGKPIASLELELELMAS